MGYECNEVKSTVTILNNAYIDLILLLTLYIIIIIYYFYT